MSEGGTGMGGCPAVPGSSPEAGMAFNEGLRLAKIGDLAGALQWLRRAEALEGESPDTHRLLGKVAARLGHVEQAEAAFRRASQIGPGDPAARACLTALQRYRFCRRMLAAAAGLTAGLLICGGIWYSWSKLEHLESAVAQLEKKQAIPPAAADKGGAAVEAAIASHAAPLADPRSTVETRPDEFRQAGETPHSTEIKRSKADREMPRKSDQAPVFKLRYRAAVDLAMAGDLRGAIPRLEELAAAEFANQALAGNVHFWLGRCLFGTGDFRRALEHFRTVTEKHADGPKTEEALLDCGRCYSRLGEKDKAIESWKRVMEGSFDRKLVSLAERLIERAR